MERAGLVPELYCSDFERTLEFYCGVLGFSVCYERPEDRFAYLAREGAELMIEQTRDPSRLFLAGPLEPPFGRGMHLQIRVSDVDALCAAAEAAGARMLLRLEERWYRQGGEEVGNRQFVVTDPDGYVLRLFQDLGTRQR